MVSPVHPAEIHHVTHLVLKDLGLPNDPSRVGTSVMPLPDDGGYMVTVVVYAESLTVHLLHMNADGEISPLFTGGAA